MLHQVIHSLVHECLADLRGRRTTPERLTAPTEASGRHVRLVFIVAAPEGVKALETACPHVPIFTPIVDRGVNPHKFIVPGFGDFGDRLLGTT